MSGCSAGATETTPSAPASASAVPTETAQPGPDAEETTSPAVSASEGFLTWLESSRLPDADDACDRMTPELVEKMIAELNTSWGTAVDSCEEMVTATAELYRSLDQSAEVDISVQEETATDATLFVTYLQSGDCGTIVMTRGSGPWVITELSQECAV